MKLHPTDLLGSALGYFVAWPFVASAFSMEFLTDREVRSLSSSNSNDSERRMRNIKERLREKYSFITHAMSKAFMPLKPPFNSTISVSNKLHLVGGISDCPGNLYLSSLADRHPIDISTIMQRAPGHRPIQRFTKFSRVIHTHEGKSTLSDQVVKWFNSKLGTVDEVCTRTLGIGSANLFNKAYMPPPVEGSTEFTVGMKELRQAYLGFVDDFVLASCVAPFMENRSSSNTEYCLRWDHETHE